MLDLHVHALVDALRSPVGHEAGGPQFRQRIGQHELDGLVVEDGTAVSVAVPGERGGLLDEPLHRPESPRRDHQPFVPEPLVGEQHPVAFRTDEIGRGYSHVLERNHRMVVAVGVRIGRGPNDPDARCVQIDDEHGMRPGVGAVRQLGLEEDVVRPVERRDVPFDAVEQVFLAVSSGRGPDGVDVGARVLLGDRVALAPLAPDSRDHPRVELVL